MYIYAPRHVSENQFNKSFALMLLEICVCMYVIFFFEKKNSIFNSKFGLTTIYLAPIKIICIYVYV